MPKFTFMGWKSAIPSRLTYRASAPVAVSWGKSSGSCPGVDGLPKGLSITHADQVVEMCDNPATAFKEKKDSSLTVGLNMVKNGEGDAFVSAGSTGALLAGATLLVKRIKGIRPGPAGRCPRPWRPQ